MKVLQAAMLLVIWITPAHSQNMDIDQWLVWMIDRYGDELDEASLADRLNTLDAYLSAPRPVSTLDEPTLQALELLTDQEIKLILKWIHQPGERALNEDRFRQVPDVDEMVIELIIAISTFDSDEMERVGRRWWDLKSGALRGRVDIKSGIVYPRQDGYKSGGNYLGPGFTLREHYVLQSEIISAQFSRYKMAGEPMDYPRSMGPWTGSLMFHTHRSKKTAPFRIRTVILGDHRFRSGHGLIASTASMRSDGRQQRASSISSAPVTPNGASPSGKFHRGLALWASAGHTDLALSFSHRRLSASITDTLLYTPGWSTHVRTTNDLTNHHNIALSSVSVMARRHGQTSTLTYNLGVAAVGYRWSDQLSRRSGFSYQNDATGLLGLEWSTYGSVAYQMFTYTAELAQANSKTGWTQSLLITAHPLSIGVWIRRYPFGFDSRFGNPASAYGGSNESGLGAWVSAIPLKGIQLTLWTDTYRSLGPRFGTRLPVKGREWGARGEWKAGTGRRVEFTLRTRYRLENSVLPDLFNRSYDYRTWKESVSAKVAGHHKLNEFLKLKIQVSYSGVNQETIRLKGWGTSALVQLTVNSVTLYAQTSMFASEDHESRSYVYEYDMLGSFRIPAFSGYGQRSYLMGQLNVRNRLVVRIKIGVTEYLDRQVIGSGADASVGARRWGGDAQLRWMF